MEKKECATCTYWKRDGIAGVCFGSTPRPKIVRQLTDEEKAAGHAYIVVWPSTRPDERCPTYKARLEAV